MFDHDPEQIELIKYLIIITYTAQKPPRAAIRQVGNSCRTDEVYVKDNPIILPLLLQRKKKIMIYKENIQ